MSPRARQSKGKARITAYNELVAEAEAAERRADKVELAIPPGPRLGDQVVDADGVVKAFGDRLLIDGLTFILPPGGIVGVIGPNGAGKTTLFRMIVGEEEPDAGTLTVGATVALAYVDQSPRHAVAGRHGVRGDHRGVRPHGRGRPRDARPRLRGRASGSRAATSRRRWASSRAASATGCCWPRCSAAAATSCCSTSRPTTSTSTRCAPSRTRSSRFPGCAVVISHDRWFLDRIATHVLAFEGDSRGPVVGGELQRLRGRPAQAPRRSTPTSPTGCATSRWSATEPGRRQRRRRPTGALRPRSAVVHGGPSATRHAAARRRRRTRTMHEERVPKASRCTQFAALGRSSPSGIRWSASTRRKAAPPRRRRRERRAPRARGRPWPRARRGHGSPARGCPAAGRRRAVPPEVPVKSTKQSEVAVAHQQPRAVVVLRPAGAEEVLDGLGRAAGGGPARGAAHHGSAWTGPWRRPVAGWSVRRTRRAR